MERLKCSQLLTNCSACGDKAIQSSLAEIANNFMGNVVLAGNIRKESVRIDPQGNIIDARTKQIIKPVEPEFVPPEIAEPLDTIINTPKPSKIDDMINKLVEKKVEELVARKVEEALKNI